MQYKALCMDLDDTLLTTDKRISEKNEKALRKARELGVKIIFCSGRSQSRMRMYVDHFNFRDPGEYYIAFHGGMIVDAHTDQAIETHYVDPEILRWFVRLGRKYKDDLNVQLYKGERFYIERRDESTTMYESRTGNQKGILVPDFMEFIDDQIMKALFTSVVPGKVMSMKAELEETMPEGMSLVASSPYLLEYSDDRINKGICIEKLMKRLGITMEETICVGDSWNDISMIRKAGLGIAVQNAEEDVKAAADYITEHTCDEDAIAEIVEKFIFENEN